MRAAIFHAPGQPITIERMADPTPARDEVVVKICRCGICGSDLSMTAPAPFTFVPGQFGHEYAGEVVEVGRDVTRLKVGDRVACMPCLGCGKCEICRAGGFGVLCPQQRQCARGFAEYIATPAAAVVPMPAGLSMAEGALVEPIACGLRALRLAGMRGAERVLVLGAGAMAISVVFWARALGASRIVVLSRSTHRREVVLALGADAFLTAEEDDPHLIAEALGGGPHIVAEGVGKEGLVAKAVDLAPPMGTVVSLGMCMCEERILPALGAFKEIRLLFPFGYSPEEYVETVRALDAARLDFGIMVSDVVPLEALPATMNRLRADAKTLRVQIDPWLDLAAL
jgi:(R,R)-butanediol dehydrogenase/meso-butanediol dehydrogenase/diacetyl reductase